MKHLKTALLSASVLVGSTAPLAHAQTVSLPAAEIHAIGATSITTVLVQQMNCVGGNNPAGNNNGTSAPVAEGQYNGTTPTDCAAQELQSGFEGKYVGTGSGAGRAGWRTFSDQLATGKNPFDLGNTDTTWDHYQFTFSDSPIGASDLSTYNTTAAANKLGAAIQIPLFVLPVAVAYNPVYGHNTTTGADYKFNVKSTFVTKDAAGNPTGGLRLNKTDYCKIFNGEITNWNNSALRIRNGGTATNTLGSLMDPADSVARWNADGAPIRLVGRGDGSGTTDIFTRHLAAVCTGLVTLNKYDKNAQALPYNNTINMSSVLPGTPYNGTFSSTGFANNTNDAAHQSISGAFFDKTSQTINTSQGNEAAGLFMLADGSTGVRDAINFAPDKASPSAANVLLNGKVGYIGADFVKPATGATLFSAALQSGSSLTTFKGPTPANATAAFGTAILPPQSTATSGAYNRADARVSSITGVAVDRANPRDWTDVLYSNPSSTLANPAAGYAITGTTQMLTYTCFAAKPTRLAVVNLLALATGKIGSNKAEIPFLNTIFTDTAATHLGIQAQNGIAPLPAGWRTAISETFLKKSAQASNGYILGQIQVSNNATTGATGGSGLWIQNLIPTTTANANSSLSNSTCTVNAGA